VTILKALVGVVLCGLVAVVIFGAEATWEAQSQQLRDHRPWYK